MIILKNLKNLVAQNNGEIIVGFQINGVLDSVIYGKYGETRPAGCLVIQLELQVLPATILFQSEIRGMG